MSRARTGSIKELKNGSGRYYVRIWDPAQGKQVTVGTYDTKGEADAHLSRAKIRMMEGTYADPSKGKTRFADYAQRWLDERPGLGDGTVELYAGLQRNHICPTFGKLTLGAITPSAVRSWNSKMVQLDESRPKRKGSLAPKSYRHFRTIMGTAHEDNLIPTNPVNIRGAGDEFPSERPLVTVEETYALASAIGSVATGHGSGKTHAAERDRALILLAAYTGLRFGEARGLRLRYLNLDHAPHTVTVIEQYQDGKPSKKTRVRAVIPGGYWCEPKSKAGARTLDLPDRIVDEMKSYVTTLQNTGPDDVIFPGEQKGSRSIQDPVRPFAGTAFGKRWHKAVATIPSLMEKEVQFGVDLHLHDLRHFAIDLASRAQGVNDKDKMAHGGHSSLKSRRIYLHVSPEGRAAIAGHMDDRIRDALAVLADSGLVLGTEPSVEVVGPDRDEATFVLDGDTMLGDQTPHEALAPI